MKQTDSDEGGFFRGASGGAENLSQLKYYYMYKNKTSVKLIF